MSFRYPLGSAGCRGSPFFAATSQLDRIQSTGSFAKGAAVLALSRFKIVFLLVVAGCVSVQAVSADRRSSRYIPPRRPPVSPYLNLLRAEGDAPNYYTLVRPEIETRRRLEQQSREIHDLGRAADATAAFLLRGGEPATGHASYFLNYRGYYSGLPQSARSFGAGGAVSRPLSTSGGAFSTPRPGPSYFNPAR
jgi:hypothetical protein